MLFFETSGISNGFRKFYAERFDEILTDTQNDRQAIISTS